MRESCSALSLSAEDSILPWRCRCGTCSLPSQKTDTATHAYDAKPTHARNRSASDPIATRSSRGSGNAHSGPYSSLGLQMCTTCIALSTDR